MSWMGIAVYYRAIRTYWWPVLALAILGGTASALAAEQQQAVYRAETHLLVSFLPTEQAIGDSGPSAPEMDALKQRRVKGYARMLSTPRVTEPVIRSLGLPYTPAELAGHIFAMSPLNTFAIDIAVTDTSASRAAQVANALVDQLTQVAQREKPTEALPVQTQIQVVKAAVPPHRPLPVRWQLKMAVGALAGSGLGLGLAVLLQHAREGRPGGADLRELWSSASARVRKSRSRQS